MTAAAIAEAHCSAALAEIEQAILQLQESAQAVADDYFHHFCEQQNLPQNRGYGSRLCSVRSKQGVNGSTLEIRWLKSTTGDQGRVRHSYNKGAAARYNTGKICKGSPEWERKLVDEAEDQFAIIREIYGNFVKCRTGLIRARSSAKKNQN
jgi:hypothetical protein